MNTTDSWKKPFLSFETSLDLLKKAKRELERFEKDPSADHAFNFFVTIYHIRDWAKEEDISIKELEKDQDFELCRLACNHGKHFRLTNKGILQRVVDRQYESHSDTAFFDTQRFAILADNKRWDIVSIGHRVITKIAKLLGE